MFKDVFKLDDFLMFMPFHANNCYFKRLFQHVKQSPTSAPAISDAVHLDL